MKNQLFDFTQLQKIDKLYFSQQGKTDQQRENKQKKERRLKKKAKNLK
jgi:hypothetical protein